LRCGIGHTNAFPIESRLKRPVHIVASQGCQHRPEQPVWRCGWLNPVVKLASVKGSVMVCPLQLPVSARSRTDSTVSGAIRTIIKANRIDTLSVAFINFSPACTVLPARLQCAR